MTKRKLTLLVELEDRDTSAWIWMSHREHCFWNGLKVKVICEGDWINYEPEEEEGIE